VTAENDNKTIYAELEKLQDVVYPQRWVDSDDPMVQEMRKAQMHERHPSLIKAGTEVVKIDSVLPDPEPWQDQAKEDTE
jgi:hypothetical protein